MPFDVQQVRAQFPALALRDEGQARLYLDNPGGTQVAQPVLDRMARSLVHHNANRGGAFRTSVESDAVLDEAHQAMADLLGAASADEVVFGPNMTTLTFMVSRALGRGFRAGDEVIVTRMDHDANVSPWLHLADDLGLAVRWLDFDPATYRYRLDDLDALLTDRTRVVAVAYASNATGTINDVRAITERAHAAGALVYVDAVQYVPHAPTDVQALGCDFLACSAYKFYGPHQGILWGRHELLEGLRAYKVRPAQDRPPHKFETGTQSHEGQAGTLGAVAYLAWIGETMAASEPARFAHLTGRRRALVAAMDAIAAYERTLSAHLLDGLRAIPGLTVHGLTDPAHLGDRVPTVSFTLEGWAPQDLARRLAARNIFTWAGHYYAVEVVRRLGLADRGGMLRVGMGHYNTVDELDRLLAALHEAAGRA